MTGISTLRLTALTAVALALTLAAAATRAADPEPAYSVMAGGETYKSYCANCHGVDGRGEGVIAPTLATKPTDLTQLTAKNDGEYPAERMREVVDGRAEVAAHGSREMPVWGDSFIWPETDSPARREEVKRTIGELVAYLRTIQAPAQKH